MTTPWPAKAASPWMEIGSTLSPVLSRRRSWRARTEPSTTGETISRWDGLNASARCTSPPGVMTLEEKPWWYFTSPEDRPSAFLPSNSSNRSRGFLPKVLTRTFRRPRWAMPMTISLAP
ncbi:hypothetical protein D9M71_642790 [compost metagenome]